MLRRTLLFAWLETWLRSKGRIFLKLLVRIGRMTLFVLRVLIVTPRASVGRFRQCVQQIYSVGVRTLIVVVVAGMFVGMVLSLQGHHILVQFNAEESLGVLVALSLLRELAPVITGLLFAGRAGSALTSEIALMQTTEQISAIEMMAVDPFRLVYAPRMLAGLVSLPLLTLIFILTSILGSYMIAVGFLGVDQGAYWGQMQQSVIWLDDVGQGLVKSAVFGLLVTWIALYEGVYARPSSVGIGDATTRTVVSGSLAVLGSDFIITAFMI